MAQKNRLFARIGLHNKCGGGAQHTSGLSTSWPSNPSVLAWFCGEFKWRPKLLPLRPSFFHIHFPPKNGRTGLVGTLPEGRLVANEKQ